MKHLLTIAGSDCSGGAGIQADLKTFSALGTYGMSVISSVVAENTCRLISSLDVPPEIICDQIDAVFEDIRVDGVKVGMLSGVETMKAVAEKLKEYTPPNVVVDTVMVTKGGESLMESSAAGFFRDNILPLAHILTPNIPEAEVLTEKTIETIEDMKLAAVELQKMGAKSVILKGGHFDGPATDIFYDGTEFHTFTVERINTKNTHGTGCTLSSAIAVFLAKGMEPYRAVEAAKKYVTTAIEHSLPIGKGNGPTNHFYELYRDGGLD